MGDFNKTIKEIDLTQIDEKSFVYRFVGCIILTHDDKYLLQEIVNARKFFPAGSLTTFGGRVESKEQPEEALIRELNEELGAIVDPKNITYLGAITEEATNHTELIYAYFWQDKNNTITGCYEDRAKYFDSLYELLADSNVTDDVKWMIIRCRV